QVSAVLRTPYTSSPPSYFHCQRKMIAARLALRDLTYPSEILRRQESRCVDRARERRRLIRRKNLRLEGRGSRRLYPSNKCAKFQKPCQTSEEKHPHKNRLFQFYSDRCYRVLRG